MRVVRRFVRVDARRREAGVAGASRPMPPDIPPDVRVSGPSAAYRLGGAPLLQPDAFGLRDILLPALPTRDYHHQEALRDWSLRRVDRHELRLAGARGSARARRVGRGGHERRREASPERLGENAALRAPVVGSQTRVRGRGAPVRFTVSARAVRARPPEDACDAAACAPAGFCEGAVWRRTRAPTERLERR